MIENEMVGWHHQFNGHEFEQTQGDSEGKASLACCNSWDYKESDTTYRLNNKNNSNSNTKISRSRTHRLAGMKWLTKWHNYCLTFLYSQPFISMNSISVESTNFKLKIFGKKFQKFPKSNS